MKLPKIFEPITINKTEFKNRMVVSAKGLEQWVYGLGDYLYFKRGRVVDWSF